MVQPASETECLIPVAAGVRMRLSLTTSIAWKGPVGLGQSKLLLEDTGLGGKGRQYWAIPYFLVIANYEKAFCSLETLFLLYEWAGPTDESTKCLAKHFTVLALKIQNNLYSSTLGKIIGAISELFLCLCYTNAYLCFCMRFVWVRSQN